MRYFIEACTPVPEEYHYRDWGHHVLTRQGSEVADQLAIAMRSADLNLVERLSEITVPTLYLHGRQDRFAKTQNMEFAASRIRNSALVIIENTGHLPLVTRAAAGADAINRFFTT